MKSSICSSIGSPARTLDGTGMGLETLIRIIVRKILKLSDRMGPRGVRDLKLS